jgi:hypothetical protein
MPQSSSAAARGAASNIQDSTIFRGIARGGYAVNGLLHILIGGIAISVATGGGGEADQGGALSSLAANPGGVFVLWVVVIGLWALGLFQLTTAVLVRGTDKDAWAERAKEGGKGVAYIAVGSTALTYALGGSSSSSGDTQSLSATLLASPGGVVLLLLVAAGVAAVGIYFIVKGAKKKFLEDITLPSGTAGRVTKRLGIFGYIVKGVAITVVGILFGVAAVTTDPSAATGLDGALKSLAELPFGAIILGVIAVGLIAYGIYCMVRARYARL